MTASDKDPRLLTPGPLTTSKATKEAMLHDWGSRDRAFIETNKRLRQRLLAIANSAGSHVCVPLQGSGTFVVEATLGTLIPPRDGKKDGKALVLINGAYGSRMVKILDYAGRAYEVLETPEDTPPDLGALEVALKASEDITHVLAVHLQHQIQGGDAQPAAGQHTIKVSEVVVPVVALPQAAVAGGGVGELGIGDEPMGVAHVRENERGDGIGGAAAEGAPTGHLHADLGREPGEPAAHVFVQQVVAGKDEPVAEAGGGEVARGQAGRVALHTHHWPAAAAPRGQVLICHGLGEHMGRYAHVAASLNAHGWDVHGWDHRGHGHSGGPRGDVPGPDALLRDTALVIEIEQDLTLRAGGYGEEVKFGGATTADMTAFALDTS